MKWTTDTISDLQLEKYLLDELTPGQRECVENLIQNDPVLKQKLAMMQRENENFSTNHPFPGKPKSYVVSSKSRSSFASVTPSWSLALASIVLAVTATIMIPQNNGLMDNSEILREEMETTRLKGIQPSIKIYRKTSNGYEALIDNSLVAEHDVLQLAYIPGNNNYGMIFSLDGNAQITLHYPYSKSDTTQLNKNGETRLSFSYELDNAPEFERFVFLSSDHPLNVERILRTASNPRDFANLLASNQIQQASINLRKETP